MIFPLASYHKEWILSLVKGYRWKMFAFFLLELITLAFTLLFIYYSKRTIDIALKMTEGDLLINIFLVVLFSLSGIILRILSQWINQRTQIDMTLRFQYAILEKQMLSVWKVVKKWNTGDLMVRINSDCSEIVQMVSTTWISFIVTCLRIITSFIFLYTMDKMLALIIVCITPLFLLSKIYFRKMKELNAQVKTADSQIGTALQENLRYRIILRALGVINNRFADFKSKQDNLENLKFKYLNFGLLSQGVMRSAMTIGYLIAFVWGIYKLQDLTITFGTMTAFLQLVNQVQSPILSLGSFFPAFVRFRVSADRIAELNYVEQEPLLPAVQFSHIDNIRFENVEFKYEEEVIIKNLSTQFNKGEFTAILGASGKGKTTLIRLLLGLIKPEKGYITIQEQGVQHILTTAHVDNFSYVPQGNTLLTGTIKDNITLGIGHVSEERLKEILYLSCAEFIYDLPKGLDTLVGESGLGLSEGQAQRVAIARAILRNRKVWLFDEATSALDHETIKIFLNRIKNIIDDKIVIFVTHDSTVAFECHKQLIMD